MINNSHLYITRAIFYICYHCYIFMSLYLSVRWPGSWSAMVMQMFNDQRRSKFADERWSIQKSLRFMLLWEQLLYIFIISYKCTFIIYFLYVCHCLSITRVACLLRDRPLLFSTSGHESALTFYLDFFPFVSSSFTVYHKTVLYLENFMFLLG